MVEGEATANEIEGPVAPRQAPGVGSCQADIGADQKATGLPDNFRAQIRTHDVEFSVLRLPPSTQGEWDIARTSCYIKYPGAAPATQSLCDLTHGKASSPEPGVQAPNIAQVPTEFRDMMLWRVKTLFSVATPGDGKSRNVDAPYLDRTPGKRVLDVVAVGA
jgi:hypothetical protein